MHDSAIGCISVAVSRTVLRWPYSMPIVIVRNVAFALRGFRELASSALAHVSPVISRSSRHRRLSFFRGHFDAFSSFWCEPLPPFATRVFLQTLQELLTLSSSSRDIFRSRSSFLAPSAARCRGFSMFIVMSSNFIGSRDFALSGCSPLSYTVPSIWPRVDVLSGCPVDSAQFANKYLGFSRVRVL